MRVRKTLFVLLGLISSGARAEKWSIAKMSGEVAEGKNNLWRALKSDEPVCAGAEIKIGRDGSLAIAADTAVVVALPNSNFKCASQGGMPGKLIDVQAGSIGIRTLLGNADPIEVKSRFLDAKTKGAAFVVSADTKTSISIVKSGDVTVRDLARQKDIEATAGQLLKFGPSG